MPTFHSDTTIDFESEEDLEAMVRQLPLGPHQIDALLQGDEVVDDQDESDVTGSGKVVHKFKITGEE